MTATTTKPYGGYAIKGYRALGGEETVAFTATLTRDGKPVATVRNDGCGGSNLFRFLSSADWAPWSALAQEMFPGQFEPEDRLFERLHLIGQLNRARTVAFIYDGMDPFEDEDGRYRSFRQGVTFRDALRYLSGPGHADKRPSVWVKDRSQFVPVADLLDA